jgi:hypothetical protein
MPKPSRATLGQGKDGRTHITYFDAPTAASFVWDGRQDKILVSIGGYAEPVHHTIPAPEVLGAKEEYPEDRTSLEEGLAMFTDTCKVHARNLAKNTKWDEMSNGDWNTPWEIKHYADIRVEVS